MSITFFTLDLKARAKTIGDVPSGKGIEFLSMEIADDPACFLALVHFSVDGKESESGLRIELGKGAFLDDVYGPTNALRAFSEEQMEFLVEAAPILAAMATNQDLSL